MPLTGFCVISFDLIAQSRTITMTVWMEWIWDAPNPVVSLGFAFASRSSDVIQLAYRSKSIALTATLPHRGRQCPSNNRRYVRRVDGFVSRWFINHDSHTSLKGVLPALGSRYVPAWRVDSISDALASASTFLAKAAVLGLLLSSYHRTCHRLGGMRLAFLAFLTESL
ncbi:hypothetical protein STSO111631_19465 [Stackebrandtia soli]